MKSKSMMLWLVALTCGLVAMLGVRQVMNKETANVKPVEEFGQVLVALEDIGPGTLLNEGNTAFKKWPLKAIPEGVVTKLEQYEERATMTRAVPGEPIMLAKLGARGVSGASTEIPNGMRVITVKVNQTTNHSGLMLPGDRVDVILTFKKKSQGRGMVSRTKTVLEFIKVFATDSVRDRQADSSEVQAKNVSLLVTPEQGNLLKLAENTGQLTLAMRSPTDDSEGKSGLVDDSVFDNSEASFGLADETREFDNNFEGVEVDEDNQDEEGGIREFLTRESQPEEPQVAANSNVQEEETPSRPTWKMTIFSGQESEVAEFEFDENGKATRVEEDSDSEPVRRRLGPEENLSDYQPSRRQKALN